MSSPRPRILVYRHGGNIVDAQQHTDRTDGVFVQRVEFLVDGCDLAREEIEAAFAPVVDRFRMRCTVRFSDDVSRVGILVSKEAHCLVDLLARSRRGELAIDVPVVISNHADHAEVAEWFGVEYVHLPVTPQTKREQERAMHAPHRRLRLTSPRTGVTWAEMVRRSDAGTSSVQTRSMR